MTGLSAFILTRFDRRAILRRLLDSACRTVGARAAFLSLDGPESAVLGADGKGGDPGEEAFIPWSALAVEASRRGAPRCAVDVTALPLVLRVGKDADEPGKVERAVPPRLEEVLGVVVFTGLSGAEHDGAGQPAATVAAAAEWLAASIATASVAIEAQTDRVTGLLNRGLFARRLAGEIAACGSSSQPLALLMVDLHRLDSINRTLGRERGDALLRLLGRTLHGRIRWRDIAARLGGDEFVAALPGAAETAALGIAGRLREQFALESRALGLPPAALNIGVAVWPDHAADPATLLRRADQALTASKRLGAGRALAWRRDFLGVRERTDRLEGLLMADPAEDYARTLLLVDTVADVSTAEDGRNLMSRLLDRMTGAADAERACLYRAEEDGTIRAALARDRNRNPLETDPHAPLPALVEKSVVGGESASAPGALAVPLRGAGGAAGVVLLERSPDAGPWDPATPLFLEALGHEAALIIERHRLTADLERREREIEDLNRRLQARVAAQDRQISEIRGALEQARGGAAPLAQPLIGTSSPIREAIRTVRMAAPTGAPVLLIGETGTGKEMLARELHRASGRASAPFLAVNCAAIPQGLIESELFGHARGAFTGADRERTGFFEEASGGTLFLDEISSTSPRFQAKLLRALQEGRIRRVGETADREVDVRIVAAVNVDLTEAIRRKEFREDLYYRLAVFTVPVPPLRERPADVPLLARAFLDEIAPGALERRVELDPAALARLSRHSWPGNVRELRNLIERLAALADGGRIGAAEVEAALSLHPLVPGRASEEPARPGSRDAGAPGSRLDSEERAARLLEEICATGRTFWDVARARYLDREITREDVRALIALGMTRAGGSYKKTAVLFNLPPADYKRFLDFVHNHDLRAPRQAAVPALAH